MSYNPANYPIADSNILRGSLIMNFNNPNNDANAYYTVTVNSDLRNQEYSDSNNLFTTYLYVGDVVTVTIYGGESSQYLGAKRTDYTTDAVYGDNGINTVNVSSIGNVSTLTFTATTVNTSYNFEYKLNLGTEELSCGNYYYEYTGTTYVTISYRDIYNQVNLVTLYQNESITICSSNVPTCVAGDCVNVFVGPPPSPTPTPSNTPPPSPTPSITPSITPTISLTPTNTPTPSVTPSQGSFPKIQFTWNNPYVTTSGFIQSNMIWTEYTITVDGNSYPYTTDLVNTGTTRNVNTPLINLPSNVAGSNKTISLTRTIGTTGAIQYYKGGTFMYLNRDVDLGITNFASSANTWLGYTGATAPSGYTQNPTGLTTETLTLTGITISAGETLNVVISDTTTTEIKSYLTFLSSTNSYSNFDDINFDDPVLYQGISQINVPYNNNIVNTGYYLNTGTTITKTDNTTGPFPTMQQTVYEDGAIIYNVNPSYVASNINIQSNKNYYFFGTVFPNITPSPTPTPSITPTQTKSPTPTPTITPTNTTTPTVTPTNTVTPSVTATLTPTPSITSTITPTPSGTGIPITAEYVLEATATTSRTRNWTNLRIGIDANTQTFLNYSSNSTSFSISRGVNTLNNSFAGTRTIVAYRTFCQQTTSGNNWSVDVKLYINGIQVGSFVGASGTLAVCPSTSTYSRTFSNVVINAGDAIKIVWKDIIT